jgi:cell division protein FtsB
MLAGLLALLALNLWQGRNTERAIERVSTQLDAQEQARIDMLEARVISLEKTQARLRAKIEEPD